MMTPIGRALDTLYAYGVTELYSLSTAPRPSVWDVVRPLRPSTRRAFMSRDGPRDHSDEEPALKRVCTSQRALVAIIA